MRTVMLNSAQLTERESAHEYLAFLLDLPDYYGRNLDALYDCLTDLTDVRVVILNSGEGSPVFQRILRVFRDAQRDNRCLQVELR